PEWYLTQVLKWMENSSTFMEEKIQPIFDQAGQTISAKVDLCRGLVCVVQEKVASDASRMLYDDGLFCHLVEEVLQFEKDLRSHHSYPATLPGLLHILLEDAFLQKWLAVERKMAVEKMDAMLSAEGAWTSQYKDISDMDELKAPECAEIFMTLLQVITERYRALPSPSAQLRFFGLQKELVDDFRIRLTQVMKEESRCPLGTRYCAILNAVNYISTILRDWGDNVFFLQLQQAVVSLGDQEVLGSLEMTEVGRLASLEGSLFDGLLSLLDRLKGDMLGRLLHFLMRDTAEKAQPYCQERWLSIPPPQDHSAMSLSSSACPMMLCVRDRLLNLHQVLNIFSPPKMASTQLTDEELFSQLKCFGFTPGPITENTRPVYVKKLKKFREEQQKRGKGRGSGTSSSSTGASRPVRHDVRRLSSGRRPGLKSSVLGFSSDESDAETPLKRKGLDHLKRANRNPPLQQQQLKIRVTTPVNEANKKHHGVGTALKSNSFPSPGGQTSASLGWEIGKRSMQDHESRDEDLSDEELQNSHPVNGSSAARLNTSKLAGEYSDSDEEEVGGPGGPDRDRRSLELRRIYPTGPFLSHVDGRGSRIGGKNCVLNPIGNRTMVGGRDEEKERKGDLDALGGSRSHMFPRNSMYVSLDEDHQSKTGENNHVNIEEGTSRSNSAGRFSIGLRPRFPGSSSPTLTSKGGYPNHSPVPNHAYGPAAQKKKLAVPEDELLLQFKREEQVSSGSFSAHYLSMFLLTAACLFFLLLGLIISTAIFFPSHMDFPICMLIRLDLSGGLLLPSVPTPERHKVAQNRDFKEFIDNSLEWIIRADQDVGIRLSGQVANDPVTDVSEISWLESTHPRMPFACRFRRALLSVTSKVLLVAVETMEIKSITSSKLCCCPDVLRTHGEACQENRDLEPYLPIPHVRDSLVQPKDREVGDSWDLAIQEAILEKCSDNDGIVHISVDKNSKEVSEVDCVPSRTSLDSVGCIDCPLNPLFPQGCVYVKCLSAEHSGKAFKALHGSWFDGKIHEL
ncbi:hypothetical protein XENOCAPTIV_019178, partial [Xenoophorus captivus]